MVSNKLKKLGVSKFKFNAKKVLLTYANAEGLTKEEIEKKIKEWGGIKYVIGQETHASGKPHFHTVIQFPKKIKTANPRYFDIDTDEKRFHPNIRVQVAKNKGGKDWFAEMEQYCTKEDITPLYSEKLHMPVVAKGYAKFKTDFETWKNDIYYTKLKMIESCQLPNGRYASLQIKEPERKSIYIIHGKPGCGKTRWVEDTFEGKKIWKRGAGQYPYERFPKGTNVIIWDDIKCEDKERKTAAEELISIVNYYKTLTPAWGSSRFNPTFWPTHEQRYVFWLMNTEYYESDMWWAEVIRQERIKSRIAAVIEVAMPEGDSDHE